MGINERRIELDLLGIEKTLNLLERHDWQTEQLIAFKKCRVDRETDDFVFRVASKAFISDLGEGTVAQNDNLFVFIISCSQGLMMRISSRRFAIGSARSCGSR